MTILFGHPGASPNSHHAALAHFERGRLEALCVPWLPSQAVLGLLDAIGPLCPMVARVSRRRFTPLAAAPKVQGRLGEWGRMLVRACGRGDERLAYAANDWLMRTMAREARRPGVTAVHAYEDCSLWQFEEAKRRGKACIYDMPVGYYEAWDDTRTRLAEAFGDWLPASGLPSGSYVRPAQKRREIELADLVLAPSSFVERTIAEFHPTKRMARAPYGVDADFWTPSTRPGPELGRPLRLIYAGQLSLRKGTPDLIEAWSKADLREAELELVGPWLLAEAKKRALPPNANHLPPMAPVALREHYRAADLIVVPSYFEGSALVLTEAMACGLPAIASTASGGADIVDDACGWLVEPGDVDGLVEALRWAASHRDALPGMGRAARQRAEELTWERYRERVAAAVAPYV